MSDRATLIEKMTPGNSHTKEKTMSSKVLGAAICVIAVALLATVPLQPASAGVCSAIGCSQCAESGQSCGAGASSMYDICEDVSGQTNCEASSSFSTVCSATTTVEGGFCCPGGSSCNGSTISCGNQEERSCVWNATTNKCEMSSEGGTPTTTSCEICVC